MSWIKTISYAKATAQLKSIYKRVKGPDNNIDNVLMLHSLRPHTLLGHMTLYKSVLHHTGNTLPKWYLESIGVYVSYLNDCAYCVEHHSAGLKRLLNDDEKYYRFMESIENDKLKSFFDPTYFSGMAYVKKLTLSPNKILKHDFTTLQDVGFSDGEILEINQVTSYFNYVNRSVLGLGVNTKGDIIGLSPKENDNPENWNHT
ncbi:carboxymuconolactone decarboxylase family protein [Maribacter sp. HTCC2170]|uniref:carboxymuconolactone decarboxylase family protein n=1 Tax=Maribacter sp. (strain HTCC2170 / KCCM 42371) TaxID=313603 RepID=UPI00006B471B|nr:peroxidase-related enzyme [Maribacter sp. HTCC2170]EAR01703.1 alkylhydroperoxidase AhpD family core domain protein [Maribacter sp. HTCC2170]